VNVVVHDPFFLADQPIASIVTLLHLYDAATSFSINKEM
jgi:hypothetical protein